MNIQIKVVKDFDGYFENWAKNLAHELEKLPDNAIETITVNSGPYKSYGLSYDIIVEKKQVDLDFYSAVRTGFGSMGCTPKELAEELNEKINRFLSKQSDNA